MKWEFDLLYWFQSLHNPVLDKIALFFTLLGEKGLFWIVLILAILFIVKDKRFGLTGCGALFLSILLCNIILKHLFHRDRPCWIDPSIQLLVEVPDDYSFPSGHTSISFAGATAIVQFNKKWGIAALIVAALVGLSRLYLFVHFPTDVLVGMIVGIVSGVLSGIVIRAWYKAHPDFKVPILERQEK